MGHISAFTIAFSYFTFCQLQRPDLTWKWSSMRMHFCCLVSLSMTDMEIGPKSLSSIWENVHLYKTNNAEHSSFIYLDWNSLPFFKCLCVHYASLQCKCSLCTLPSAVLSPVSAPQERSFSQKWYYNLLWNVCAFLCNSINSRQRGAKAKAASWHWDEDISTTFICCQSI